MVGRMGHIGIFRDILHLCRAWTKMADSSVKDSQRLLRQCASTLFSAVSRLGNNSSAESSSSLRDTSGRDNSSSSLPVVTPVVSPLEEHRKLFGFQPPTASRRSDDRGKGGKRRKVDKPQWCHTFVCLGKIDDCSAPSFIEKGTLAIAGLGEKKIAFPGMGKGCKVFVDTIEHEFPKLKDAGGFEILRVDSKILRVIPPPSGGYTVDYLRGVLSQAKGYIRPLQRNLSRSAYCPAEVEESFTVQCLNCGTSIPCNEFRKHQNNCTRRSASATTLSSSEDSSVVEQIECDRVLAEQLQDNDDDDDDISPTSALPSSSEAVSFPSTLQEAPEKIKSSNASSNSDYITFFVQRSRVWKNVFEELRNSELSTCKISVEFIGECAADTGGPTRELFSLVYKQVIDGKLTRGSFPNLTFTHDQGALMADEYKHLGQLTALAFLNKASTPHFFSPSVAHYMLGTHSNLELVNMVDELPDDQVVVKEKLKALLQCETTTDWDEAIVQFEERFDMGINKATIPLHEKEDFIKATNKHIMVSCVAEEIFSFQEGLSAFGVLDALKGHPEESVKHFIFAKLTTEDVRKSFVPNFSVSGSSKRQSEETIVFTFNQFLKQCEKGNIQRSFIDITTLESGEAEESDQTLTLHDVLQFMSGASHLPLGSIQGSIQFLHNADKGQRVKANTCALQLTIPVNSRYFSEESSVFIANFADDIFDGQGYGCV